MTLYVSDLDGTLLRPNATLSGYSRDGLNELIRQGVQFTVASARSVESMKSLLSGLELRLPVIDFNGAFISDLQTGKHLERCTLSWSIADQLFEISRRADFSPFVSTAGGDTDYLYPSKSLNSGADWYLQDRIAKGDPILQSDPWDDAGRVDQDLICLAFIERAGPLRALKSKIEAAEPVFSQLSMHLIEDTYVAGWYWLLVADKRAEKHIAVESFLPKYAPQSSELVAFGDNVNDLEMLNRADRSFAVQNAVEEVLTAVDVVIGPNNSDAVVKQIEREVST